MKAALIVAVAFVAIATAANADGYRAATQLEQVKAACELAADGMVQPDSPYYGDPRYAGFASFGNAVGGAIRHARDYDNCMVLHGFAKDQSPSNTAELSVPVGPDASTQEPIAPSKPKAHAPRTAQVRTPSKAHAPHDYIDDLPISAYEKCNMRHIQGMSLGADGRSECDVNPQWDGK
jgi:hypothetical protein